MSVALPVALDPWRLLGLNAGTSREGARTKYRELARMIHPDANASPVATEMMRMLNLAWEAIQDGAPWPLPDGFTFKDWGRCRSCGALIKWCATRNGKHAPVDSDGVSHFATCPQSEQWRKQR